MKLNIESLPIELELIREKIDIQHKESTTTVIAEFISNRNLEIIVNGEVVGSKYVIIKREYSPDNIELRLLIGSTPFSDKNKAVNFNDSELIKKLTEYINSRFTLENIIEGVKHKVVTTDNSILLPSQDELKLYSTNTYYKNKVLSIRKHFRKYLSILYPSGNRLIVDKNELYCYECLLEFTSEVSNFTDTTNILNKYGIKLSDIEFSYSNQNVKYLCARFNALLLKLIIIKKFNNNHITLKKKINLTGNTLTNYINACPSAYNTKTIKRINDEIGNYLIMV